MPIGYFTSSNYYYSTSTSSNYYYRVGRVYVVRWIKFPQKQQIDWSSPEAEAPRLTSTDVLIKEVRISAGSYKELLDFIDRYVIRELGKRIGKVIDIREETEGSWYY